MHGRGEISTAAMRAVLRELDLEEHEEMPNVSGDALAAELTQFLRERDAENGDDTPRDR